MNKLKIAITVQISTHQSFYHPRSLKYVLQTWLKQPTQLQFWLPCAANQTMETFLKKKTIGIRENNVRLFPYWEKEEEAFSALLTRLSVSPIVLYRRGVLPISTNLRNWFFPRMQVWLGSERCYFKRLVACHHPWRASWRASSWV